VAGLISNACYLRYETDQPSTQLHLEDTETSVASCSRRLHQIRAPHKPAQLPQRVGAPMYVRLTQARDAATPRMGPAHPLTMEPLPTWLKSAAKACA
jgi:hypothetical protein